MHTNDLLEMVTRVDAGRVLEMLSDTEAESEDSMYYDSESENSDSCSDDWSENENDDESDDDDENIEDSSEESDEEALDSTATRGGRGRGAGWGRSMRARGCRGRGAVRGRAAVTGARRGRGRGRSGGRSGTGRRKQTPEDLYKWMVVNEGRCGSNNFLFTNKHIYTNVDSDEQPTSAPFTAQAGPNVPSSCETPQDCFSLFFDDNLLQYIVQQTNTYAQKKIAAMQVE